MDPDTGRVDLRYNPMSVEEDYFVPVRGNVSSRIESLAGGSYTGDIDDVKYLRDKLFAALKIPPSYLSTSEDSGEDKTTLAQKDVRFARTVQRLQRVVIAELEKMGIIHLYTLGYRGDDLLSFKMTLNNPSKMAELQELEHWKMRFDTAASATQGFFSRRWIAENLFAMGDEEFIRNEREMFYDKKFEAMLEVEAEAIVSAGSVEAEADAMEIAQEEGLAPPPGEEPPPEEGAEELPPEGDIPPEGEEGMLLAEPGKRDDEVTIRVRSDGSHLTQGSKGHWYNPSEHVGPGKQAGARRRNLLSQMGMSDVGRMSSDRGRLPGYAGPGGLESYGHGIVATESQETMVDAEEKKLFEVSYEMKKLITELESKDEKNKA
jgi:hypothetical protein